MPAEKTIGDEALAIGATVIRIDYTGQQALLAQTGQGLVDGRYEDTILNSTLSD